MHTGFDLAPEETVRRELLPDPGSLGPAMKQLNERQQLYVMACLDLGCANDHTQAARIAGYTDGNALKVTAFRLAHHPKVQAAMLEEAKKRLQAGTMAATAFLIDTVTNPGEETKDRLKAAAMVLDRGGLHGVSEHRAVEGGPADRTEKLLRLAVLAKLLGQDPKALLGNLADAVEGDFKVVESEGGAA